MKYKMNENTSNSILYVCVASVFLTWAITSYLEDMQELKQEQEIVLDAFKNGYVQCAVNNTINATFVKIVWQKECNKSNPK